jgi:flagellar hook-length control protein FliK
LKGGEKMTGQNFFVDLMSKLPTTGQEIKKPEFNKSNYSRFNDVLSSTINKAPADNNSYKKDSKPLQKNDVDIKNSNQKTRFKTFKDISLKEKPKLKETSVESKGMVEELDKTKTKKVEKESSPKKKVAVEALAEVMGMTPEDLMKVLSSLNIKPEALTNTAKVEEVVNKLTGLMNLNTEQKQALSEIFKTLKSIMDEKSNQPAAEKIDNITATAARTTTEGTDAENAGWMKLENVDLTVVKLDNLTAVSAKFKASLEQLTQKLQQNPQKLLSDIVSQVKGVIEEAETVTETVDKTKTTSNIETSDQTEVSSEEVANPLKVEGHEKADARSQGETKDNQSKEPKAQATEITLNNTIKSDNGSTLQLNNQVTNQTQKVDDISAVVKVQKEVPVTKNEIVNQFVEKAKITLIGNKSEMTMDLKPDNLGKLALKVVTEHGIVVAKFIAESQQVKETLEANMQTLKDSLEKQGLSVQGFSVSVQQDPHKGFNRQNETGGNKKQNLGRSESEEVGTIKGVSMLENQKRVNAYNWSDSSINLTA